VNSRFYGITWFKGLIQLIQFFFFFFISFFLHVGFFSLFFFFLINLFNYHIFMTRPYSQTHIQYSWVWCCSQAHLNLGHASLMLLLILLILLLGQALQPNPRLLGIALQKNPKLLNLSFFWYFLCKKKNNNPWHRAGHVTSTQPKTCAIKLIMKDIFKWLKYNYFFSKIIL
jgi:hypothetical protein